MVSLMEHHKRIVHGEGKCSVPMWSGGVPAGFCDLRAYGERVHLDQYGGYVTGLACEQHGGPTLEEFLVGKTVLRLDGPPGPESGRFVEIERDGMSINAGPWLRDGNDWLLIFAGGYGDLLDNGGTTCR